MNTGTVEGIYIAPAAGVPLTEMAEVRAHAGVGLEGDRYYLGIGKFSPKPGFRQVTLIETEALAALKSSYDIDLPAAQARRNILTRDVALNHLVGREFLVGEVRLLGMKLCEPCAYLEELLGRSGPRMALVHRGGLRAEILDDGMVRRGDEIRY